MAFGLSPLMWEAEGEPTVPLPVANFSLPGATLDASGSIGNLWRLANRTWQAHAFAEAGPAPDQPLPPITPTDLDPAASKDQGAA